MFRHELARYHIPNEQVQQAAGQRQDGDNFETMGIVSYQHIFSSNVVGDFRGMVRDNSEWPVVQSAVHAHHRLPA